LRRTEGPAGYSTGQSAAAPIETSQIRCRPRSIVFNARQAERWFSLLNPNCCDRPAADRLSRIGLELSSKIR